MYQCTTDTQFSDKLIINEINWTYIELYTDFEAGGDGYAHCVYVYILINSLNFNFFTFILNYTPIYEFASSQSGVGQFFIFSWNS